MIKLLLILVMGGALANGVASLHSQQPLLIDSSPSPISTDSVDISN